MSKRRKKKRSSKTKRWGIIFGIELVLILILIPVVFVYAKLSLIQTASASDVDKANIVINNDVDATTQKALKGYRNIALFGVDSRDGSLQTGARSDSIMVISINQETKDVKITSIYRDTCLKVPGYGFSKATHAYAYGGAELSMSMLNTNLDLDITEFATVDFGVLAKIIDAVGGIDLDISDAEYSLINPLIDEQNSVTVLIPNTYPVRATSTSTVHRPPPMPESERLTATSSVLNASESFYPRFLKKPNQRISEHC